MHNDSGTGAHHQPDRHIDRRRFLAEDRDVESFGRLRRGADLHNESVGSQRSTDRVGEHGRCHIDKHTRDTGSHGASESGRGPAVILHRGEITPGRQIVGTTHPRWSELVVGTGTNHQYGIKFLAVMSMSAYPWSLKAAERL